MTKRAALCTLLMYIGFHVSSSGLQAQALHHQMLSAQGTSQTTSSGIRVRQIIGQQSVSGSSSGTYVVQQGYQQAYWDSYFPDLNTIEVQTFPNPFTETVNFKFISPDSQVISIEVFDINGRLVYSNTYTSANNLVSINLPNLESNVYLVTLSGENMFYSTKIIKEL